MKKNPYYDWGPPIYKNPKPQIDQIVWRWCLRPTP